MKNYTPEFKKIDLSMLEVHPRVQRGLRPRHVKEICEDFNDVALRPLIVMDAKLGRSRKRWIIDGQHTFEALKAKGRKDSWCGIVTAKGNEEINEIFQLLNARVQPLSTVDSFNLNEEWDPDSPDAIVSQILADSGLYIGCGDREDTSQIACAGAVRNSYNTLGEEYFSKAARIWGNVALAGNKIDGAVVNGTTEILKTHPRGRCLTRAERNMSNYMSEIKALAKERCLGVDLSRKPKEFAKAARKFWE